MQPEVDACGRREGRSQSRYDVHNKKINVKLFLLLVLLQIVEGTPGPGVY